VKQTGLRRSRFTYFAKKQEEKLKHIQKEKFNHEHSLGSKEMTNTAISTVPSILPESIFDGCHTSSDSKSKISDASATSYAVTMAKGEDEPIRVPNPPLNFYKELPFECPYCFTLLSGIHTRRLGSK
jgi:hypothetical protein